MRVIEPGCLVMVVKSRHAEELGKCSIVGATVRRDDGDCIDCGRVREWELPDILVGPEYDPPFLFGCECCLIRIDGDPDAVDVDERQEVEA